jgi:hypothetical protein
VQSDDIVAGEHVGLPGAAVGVESGGFVFQAKHVKVKFLIESQIADGYRNVIDGLNAILDFRPHVVSSDEQ